MGKSKSRNRVKDRDNPIAREVKPPTDPELVELREKHVLPVLKDLQSSDQNTRSAAAGTITTLIGAKKVRKLLLREQIVKILLEQTLHDGMIEARSYGWGILRDLVEAEERDFCVHLYRQDILTAIAGAGKVIIFTYRSNEVPFENLPPSQQNILWEMTSTIISLIEALSKASEEINQAITKRFYITEFLIGVLRFSGSPDGLIYKINNCLAVLLEDNEELATRLLESDEEVLDYWITTKDLPNLKGVSACRVLHSVCGSLKWYDHNTPKKGACDAALIPALVKFMKGAHDQVWDATMEFAELRSTDQILHQALEITADIAASLQDALEHSSRPGSPQVVETTTNSALASRPINGKGSEAEGEEEDEEEEEDDEMVEEVENAEMDEDEMEADMDLVTGNDEQPDDAASGSATLELLVRKVAPRVIEIILKENELFSEDFKEDEPSPVALSTLNNIAWAVAIIDFSGDHLDSIYKAWIAVALRIWGEVVSPVLDANTADVEKASMITSIAWAVARSLKGKLVVKSEQALKFMALYHSATNITSKQKNGAANVVDSGEDPFQRLDVKCIGVLGSMAVGGDSASVALNREIGIFLLQVLSGLPNVNPAVAIETLNQIFEIYADKSYEYDQPVFWELGLYRQLENLQHGAKKMAKSIDKRLFGELRQRADDAVLNLHRFLAYKRKESPELFKAQPKIN